MARTGFVLAICVVLTIASHSNAAAVTPVQKVLQMMTEMKAKGVKMLEEEEKVFRDYTDWYRETTQNLGFDIKTANSDIEKLNAFIAKADSDVDTLTADIAELDAEISKLQGELKEATEIRAEEHAEYIKTSTDYSESVDALKRAIQTMEAQGYDRPQAEAMLQKMAKANPGMRRVFAEFLQSDSTATEPGAPEVAAYTFQSDSIIALMEKFLVKFQGELDDVEKAESNQAHNYKMEKIHLDDTITYSKNQREEKSAYKAKRAAESANAKSNLAETKVELAADEKTLADTKATYEAKTDQYHQNQEVRKNEIEAIQKAIEVISDPTVAGSYKEYDLGLSQTKTTFLQLGSARSRVSARQSAAAYLQKRARALNSDTLSALVQQIASNPFDKVIQMIKDLLARLKEEAAAEADHKQWCDQQLHNNKLKREKKTAQVNKLQAEVDSLSETIVSKGKWIATLQKEQADLVKAMKEATEQRTEEKATNTETMKDAAAGEEAVNQALVILKEFYASHAALLQQVPEMAAYKGMQSAKGGVVGMLEVIASDFARLYADTKAAEDQAAAEYATFMKDSKASVKAKHDEEFKTSLEKDQYEYERGETMKDLKATHKELDKALDYQQYLKPICLEIHVSYEERVKRREEEIAALKEAYAILDQKSTS